MDTKEEKKDKIRHKMDTKRQKYDKKKQNKTQNGQ